MQLRQPKNLVEVTQVFLQCMHGDEKEKKGSLASFTHITFDSAWLHKRAEGCDNRYGTSRHSTECALGES